MSASIALVNKENILRKRIEFGIKLLFRVTRFHHWQLITLLIYCVRTIIIPMNRQNTDFLFPRTPSLRAVTIR